MKSKLKQKLRLKIEKKKEELGDRYGHWVFAMQKRGFRRGFAEWMRWWADRLAIEDSLVSTDLRIHLVWGKGWVLNKDSDNDRGSKIYFIRNEYDHEIYED